MRCVNRQNGNLQNHQDMGFRANLSTTQHTSTYQVRPKIGSEVWVMPVIFVIFRWQTMANYWYRMVQGYSNWILQAGLRMTSSADISWPCQETPLGNLLFFFFRTDPKPEWHQSVCSIGKLLTKLIMDFGDSDDGWCWKKPWVIVDICRYHSRKTNNDIINSIERILWNHPSYI